MQRLKRKLGVFNNVQLDNHLIKSTLLNKIMPHIAGFSLKKLIKHIGLKYQTYCNKFMHRHNLSGIRINELPCNAAYIKLHGITGFAFQNNSSTHRIYHQNFELIVYDE